MLNVDRGTKDRRQSRIGRSAEPVQLGYYLPRTARHQLSRLPLLFDFGKTLLGPLPKLGIETKAPPKKRGPQSQLEKQMAAIASLPRKEQQQLQAVVDAFFTHPASH